MKNIIPLFSSPIYHSKIENFDYKEVIDQISLSNFQISKGGLLDITTEEYIIDLLPKLKQNIIRHVNNHLFENLKLTPFEYYFPDSWFVRIPPNGYANLHAHANSLFSGIVYIDVPDQGGGIRFTQRPVGSNASVNFALSVEEINIFNTESWVINPDKGDIIITPSHLYHEVLKNESDSTRHSFAFNILPYNYKHYELTGRVL